MLPLLLLLLIAGSQSQGLNVTLQCQSAADLYGLLFNICDACRLCQGLYQLEGPTEEAKFQYQVSLLEFFLVDGEVPTNWTRRNQELRFLEHIWPPAWQPVFVVQFNATTPCATSFSLTDPANLATIYVLLDLLKTYRQYIQIEAFCGDPNERLLFDPPSHRFHCLCAPGKSCEGNEGNFMSLMTLLEVLLLAFVLVLIFFVVAVGIRMFRLAPNERPLLTTFQ